MKATKPLIGASLLIALAAAAAPSAAANGLQDCADQSHVMATVGLAEGEKTEDCATETESTCRGGLDPFAPHLYLLCLIGE